MGFAMFDDQTLRAQFIVFLVFRTHGKFAIYFQQWQSRGANRRRAIIGDVKVEITVAVHIGEGERSGAVLGDEAAVGRFVKMALAIVEEKASPHASAIDQQVERAVSIDISKYSACGKLIRAGDTCRFGDVFELPGAEVSVKPISILESAQVNVAPAIAINITASDPGTIEAQLVFGGFFIGQDIGEIDTGSRSRQESESRLAFFWDRQRRRTKTCSLAPF